MATAASVPCGVGLCGAAGTGVHRVPGTPGPRSSLQGFHAQCGRPPMWKGNSHCGCIWDPERDYDAASSEGILRSFLQDVSNLSLVECQSNGKRQ